MRTLYVFPADTVYVDTVYPADTVTYPPRDEDTVYPADTVDADTVHYILRIQYDIRLYSGCGHCISCEHCKLKLI